MDAMKKWVAEVGFETAKQMLEGKGSTHGVELRQGAEIDRSSLRKRGANKSWIVRLHVLNVVLVLAEAQG